MANSIAFDTAIVVFSGLCTLVILGVTWRTLAKRPELSVGDSIDLPSGIAVHEIGTIERDLAHLEAVTIIADKVERPTDTLSQAVEHNFSRGVKYLFLVSGAREPDEVRGYFEIFEAMARVVLARQQKKDKSVRDLIEIKQLPYTWDDYPLIFYRVRLSNGKAKTLAFRGDQLQEGIADHYGRLEPSLAHTIARAIVSDGPSDVPEFVIERENFDVTSKVLRFDQRRAGEA